MRFVPYESITYKTKLECDEILKRIKGTIEPKKVVRLIKGNAKKDYEGKVEENKFAINKIISFTNVFSPVINGTITKENDEVKIDIKLRLHTIVIAVMVIWLGYVGYIFFGNLFYLIVDNISSKNLSTSFLVLVVGYIIMTLAFKSECGKEKSRLMELLEIEVE